MTYISKANLPLYAPQPAFTAITGIGKTKSWELLAKGELRAKRVGRRTLFDVPHGVAYVEAQPDAGPRRPAGA